MKPGKYGPLRKGAASQRGRRRVGRPLALPKVPVISEAEIEAADAEADAPSTGKKGSHMDVVLKRAQRAVGRPCKLDLSTIRKLAVALRSGLSLESAAARHFLAPSTVQGWRARGVAAYEAWERGELQDAATWKAEQIFVCLVLTIRYSESAFEAAMVSTVRRAAKSGRYEAALTLLERRIGSRWARVKSEAPPAAPPGSKPPGTQQGLSRAAIDTFAERVGLKSEDDATSEGSH